MVQYFSLSLHYPMYTILQTVFLFMFHTKKPTFDSIQFFRFDSSIYDLSFMDANKILLKYAYAWLFNFILISINIWFRLSSQCFLAAYNNQSLESGQDSWVIIFLHLHLYLKHVLHGYNEIFLNRIS